MIEKVLRSEPLKKEHLQSYKNPDLPFDERVADLLNRMTLEEKVVHMYIHDLFSSVTRPIKELKGFTKINLKPSKTKTISFTISPELLSFTNINMEYVVEQGEFEIMVGNSSRDEDLTKIILNVKKD
jgi:beta-glucosidase